MVQNKQKSNKINTTALITCFMLIMVFVFGCVQYANAANNLTVADVLSKYNGSSSMYLGSTQYNSAFGEIAFVDCLESFSGNICGYFYTDDSGSTSWGIVSNNPFVVHRVDKNGNFSEYNINSKSSISSSDNRAYYSFTSATHNNILDYQTSILTFSNINDAYNYIDTGEINNPIYQPKEDIEFDSDIEVPLNLDIRLNGNSDFVPNVKISCNQTEQVENRYLEIQYSIGYKATWRLLGGIGLNIKSKTSPTVYGSIEQLEDSFDNGGTSFETILSLSKLSHSVAPDEEAFSKYEPTPKVYWSLKEIKNDNSEMKIWCRNRVGNKASKWIMISGDGYKANFDVVDSDENGNPTDLKDDVANSNTGYGSDYWNNRDTTPQEDYSSANVKTNLKDLKSNYTSLANFYKELFSFLPAEIWIILIGLVSTMVIIAILFFVRG